MIFGAHVIISSKDALTDRAFFRDVLGFPAVDAGHDWLIFTLPPAELAVHPSDEGGAHELYLTCDDLGAEMATLKGKGIPCSEVEEGRWGSMTDFSCQEVASLVCTSRGTHQRSGHAHDSSPWAAAQAQRVPTTHRRHARGNSLCGARVRPTARASPGRPMYQGPDLGSAWGSPDPGPAQLPLVGPGPFHVSTGLREVRRKRGASGPVALGWALPWRVSRDGNWP